MRNTFSVFRNTLQVACTLFDDHRVRYGFTERIWSLYIAKEYFQLAILNVMADVKLIDGFLCAVIEVDPNCRCGKILLCFIILNGYHRIDV